jgi:hypothetical protein
MTKKKTIDEIINDFIKVHGNKYNYNNFIYVNYHTKGIIQCKEHGNFEQNPSNHIQGKGCRKCSTKSTHDLQKKTTSDFINDANIIHIGLYDYSKVEYTSNKYNVTIVCKIHGDFQQIPSNHLKGYGCPKCGKLSMAIQQTKSTNEFIDEAKKVHGETYDYLNVNYINAKTKIKIICKTHGEFEQEPNSHLQGNGCFQCGLLLGSSKRLKTKKDFVNEANKIHNFKYNYENTKYKGCHDNIEYICNIHGIILQNAQNHLSGRGCHKCAGRGRTTNDFITDAENIHGKLYDYSCVNYIDAITKVEVICKKHGSFYTNVNCHITKKSGCPNCSCNYSKQQIKWLNFIQTKDNICIQHAENSNEYLIPNTKFKADGYCKETNTIYEYHGDFWHGNPKIYKQNCINKRNGKTFGELYQKTLEREQQIRDMGFNLITIWESDWIKLDKCVKLLQRKFRISKLH